MVILDFFFLPFGKLEYEATCFSHVDYQKKKKGRKEIMPSDASFLLCQGIACTLRLSPHWTKTNPVWPLSLKRQEICQILVERREKKTVKISASKLNIGTGPDRREARPDYEWKRLSWNCVIFFFLNRGCYCRSESPRLFWKQAKINSPLVEDKWISLCWM